MKFKFKCIKWSRFVILFPRLLRINSSFFTYIFLIFKNFKNLIKNHQFLISDRTDPTKFELIWPNFETLILSDASVGGERREYNVGE
jgi:hypothetical protein